MWYDASEEEFRSCFVSKSHRGVDVQNNPAGDDIVARTIGVVEREGNVVRIVGSGPRGTIEVITEMEKEGSQLIFTGTHIDGPGAGTMGIRELGEFARQFGRQEGVSEIIVCGALRTTGAKIGHIPRPIRFKVR
jgi:hypothetical protein